MQYVTKMASKPIDIQHDFVVIGAPEAPQSAYVGLFASALGLAQIFSDGRTGLLLSTLDRRPDVRAAGATDDSVVTETGIRAAINAAVSGATGYWKRVGTVLSPLTAGDTINVASSGAVQAIYGICNGAVNSVGVRGSSDSGFGIYGSSDTSYGAVGISISGGGGYFNSSSGTGVIGSSGSGKGGTFTSGTNFAIEATINNSITNQRYGLLSLVRNTTGTAANGIGINIDFQIEMAGGFTQSQALIGAELTNATSATSDFIFQLRNAGSTVAEVLRLKGNGDMLSYADTYQTKAGGPVSRLRSFRNNSGTPGFLKSGDYLGSLTFDAWSSASTYAGVAGIIASATADHDATNFASKLEFWLMAASSSSPRQVGEFTPAGKLKGVFGFAVPGGDGISGTSTIITGVSYNSGTMILTFTRDTLTISGGIVTLVEAASNTVIPLSP
jgi:hypothetical protein